jgi:hypothetical protein
MKLKLFISHAHQDEGLAKVIANLLSRVTVGQIDVWFSSDDSAVGGIQPGRMWFDEIKSRLEQSIAIIVLLTPASLNKPWLYFESGMGATIPNCEIIPLCVGIDPSRDLLPPLALYQSFHLADYESLKRFLNKLLGKCDITFDEEMAEPVLKRAISDFTHLMPPNTEAEKGGEMTLADLSEEIKQYIDRRFLLLSKQPELMPFDGSSWDNNSSLAYTVPILINFPEFKRKQYLRIDDNTTVQDVLNNVYFMLDAKVELFTYMKTWILRETQTRENLIIREVGDRVPARFIFTRTSIWEAVSLSTPYSSDEVLINSQP